ncbi:class I SAM-dependent methyltransferase [Nocardia beijingensis]|uniref:class I SAM-dependent methyltransferase n=1 Tax=Nocardia beijingensis TaxID=95162 RepID=UPI00189543B8|nr:class I SAM-dependent methyltransferase [Nocardia beijingensis]MBF6465632.1 class I SAM-dependent methyltransferase [Nocardia beijingensis]
MNTTSAWKQIWDNRTLDRSVGSTLAQLMAADGLDSAFSQLGTDAWTAFVHDVADRLHLTPDHSVFEVGCGAGAFLYDLDRMGCRVGGIDQSAALIDIARDAIPHGDFAVADAADLDIEPRADIVVSCGVFLYFPSLDYARRVLVAMARKALHGVAILDVPDLAKVEAAQRFRIDAAGGPAAYADRYEGLEHMFYERDWIHLELAAAGLTGIRIEDQRIAGYGNAPFRFNAFAFRAPSAGIDTDRSGVRDE